SNTAPNAEGGFFREAGAFAYGLYMGSDASDQNRHVTTTGYASAGGTTGTHGNTGFQDRSNDLDLFFGGDMGVEWGARVHYASGSSESATAGIAKKEQSTLALGLGVVAGDLNAYVNYMINDEMKNDGTATTGVKWEDDGSMNLGVGYNWMDFTFFADYDKKGGEYSAGGAALKDTTEQTELTIGAGYTKEVSSTSRMFTDVSFVKLDAEDKDGAAPTAKVELSRTKLPVTVGFEADATSWLTLRGSISQNVFLNSEKSKSGTAKEVKSTIDNTTNVNAGATLNFGKLKVDGMIGTGGTNGTATATDAGTLSLDRLMTQVAVHYWF
ncbi:hypothetical protein OAT67_09130, partial [Bacteriovoracaceae bacterium]|nr:hypothetical protein [Bacteriovoracaceae bacterium]